MSKPKFYVVWEGVTPGIYRSWTDCQLQVKGYKGAKYKSFNSLEEAQQAAQCPPEEYLTPANRQPGTKPAAGCAKRHLPPEVELNSLAVDAACSGNPGAMEYRGVHVGSGQEVFHFGPVRGTNNIGEFLAIVHGLALIRQKGFDMPIYSDSVNALKWVKLKKCRTKLARTAETERLFQLITRAETWLKEHPYTTRLLKWETRKWGEIPADFGRK